VFVYVFEGQYGYSAVMDNTWRGTIIGTYPTIVTYPQDKRIMQAEKAALVLCFGLSTCLMHLYYVLTIDMFDAYEILTILDLTYDQNV
jgi:hypothetical protein